MRGKIFMIMGIIVSIFLLCGFSPVHAGENDNRGKTWKTVDELSAEEKTTLDLRIETPRDPQIPYLPLERFPFTPPYTAEEMGLRAMEFPHSPFWNCTLIDIAMSVTNTGFMDQRVSIIPILYLPKVGLLRSSMRQARAGSLPLVIPIGVAPRALWLSNLVRGLSQRSYVSHEARLVRLLPGLTSYPPPTAAPARRPSAQ